MADTKIANERAIDHKIRLAKEREKLLKKEQMIRASLQLQQKSSVKKDLLIEQNNNKPTLHKMTANRGTELQQGDEITQQQVQEWEEKNAAFKRSFKDTNDLSREEEDAINENIMEREIRLQKEREAELEIRKLKQTNAALSVTKSAQTKITMEGTISDEYSEQVRRLLTPDLRRPDDLSVTENQATIQKGRAKFSYEDAISNASHEGETLIVRELRETREREEELKKQRHKLLTDSGTKSCQTITKERSSPLKHVALSKSKECLENQCNEKATNQKDISSYKSDILQSADSVSSGHSTDKSQPANKNVRITSFGSKHDMLTYTTPEQPKENNKQETPIEREIKLAKERENELRIAKGLPPLQDQQKIENKMEAKNGGDMYVTKSSFLSSLNQPQPRDSLQKIASTRLQKEINKQTELEKKYRDEGKIISTSEDHVGLLKYTDIAQQEHIAPPKRNFCIKKNANDSTASVHNETEEEKPKGNRTFSGGTITFSYRESTHKAESKIGQELREMREREEELRSRRSKTGIASPSSPGSPTNISVVNKRSHFEHVS